MINVWTLFIYITYLLFTAHARQAFLPLGDQFLVNVVRHASQAGPGVDHRNRVVGIAELLHRTLAILQLTHVESPPVVRLQRKIS